MQSISINEWVNYDNFSMRCVSKHTYNPHIMNQLLTDLEAEENKKSLPKKKKEKKPKQTKVAVNPHKKEIRVSEGIWKPNPAWKKWEQENKRSASPP